MPISSSSKLVSLCVAVPLAVACSQGGASPAPTRTDVVLQWNEQVMAIGGPQIQRTLAMVHVAMFDAMNAIEPRYRPYLTLPAPPAGASKEAAAASAAHGVLLRLFPAEERVLAAALARSLLLVSDDVSETDGVRYGDTVAETMYRVRLADGILSEGGAFTPGEAPAAYRLTGGDHPEPVNTNAAEWTPFVLKSAQQFRPEPQPALTSPRYARDLAQVQRIGGLRSRDRTADQEQIAHWHSEHGDIQFNRIARTEAGMDGRDVIEHARLFALLNLAIADAVTSAFEAKYTYGFWRPVTAIRQADLDDNPDTNKDPVWSPLLPTPPHPDYPSAHSVVHAAAARVMGAYFGNTHPFQTTSGTVPGVVRSYDSFDAFAEEGASARVFAGAHFRSAVDAGSKQGRLVAEWVLDRCLTPIAP